MSDLEEFMGQAGTDVGEHFSSLGNCALCHLPVYPWQWTKRCRSRWYEHFPAWVVCPMHDTCADECQRTFGHFGIHPEWDLGSSGATDDL